MSFIASLPTPINASESIILPISMHQPLERGERLAAILTYLKTHDLQKNTTILIADYLNRHNYLTPDEALALGDAFLSEHKDFLDGFKVVRWKEYMEAKSVQFSKALYSDN